MFYKVKTYNINVRPVVIMILKASVAEPTSTLFAGGWVSIAIDNLAVTSADAMLTFSLVYKQSKYIFIHIRPRGSYDTTDIKVCRPTDHPLLLSRQQCHFGVPSESFRRCLYLFVYRIYFTVTVYRPIIHSK